MIYYLPNISSDAVGFGELAALSAKALADDSLHTEVNLSHLAWIEANMAAPLGVVLSTITNALKVVSIVAVPAPTEAILRRNGLLPAFGYPPVTTKSLTALPYQRFKLQDSSLFAQYLLDHLAGKGIPTMSSGLGKRFQQSLFEVFENAVFHSASNIGVFVCGQFFPLKQRVDITIADAGITIPRKVNETFGWNLSPTEALAWALKDGSTTKQEGKPGGVGLKLLRDFIAKVEE